MFDLLTVLGEKYGVDLDKLIMKTGEHAERLEALNLTWEQQMVVSALARSENRLVSDVVRHLQNDTEGWRERLEAATAELGDYSGATKRAYDNTWTLTGRLQAARNWLQSMISVSPAAVQAIGGIGAGLGGLVAVAPQAAGLSGWCGRR